MPPRQVKVAFAAANADLIPEFLRRFEAVAPDVPLYVVSEFPPPSGKWIPYRVDRGARENLRCIRSVLGAASIVLAAVVLQPGRPYGSMRLLPWVLAPHRTLFYNENLDHFMLRPRAAGQIVRHLAWKTRERVVRQTHPGGDLYTWLWRLRHPSELRRPIAHAAAYIAGRLAALRKRAQSGVTPSAGEPLPPGISVIIPSRNGRALLDRLLPLLLPQTPDEVIVVDNGSSDGTAEWLRSEYPYVRVIVRPEPLSFASAINVGIGEVRNSHVCLLNNDMLPDPGFLQALRRPFERHPDLFCSTAQIFFPAGKRREETGKAVMPAAAPGVLPEGFPITCVEPLAGEDESYVLYGSGGCSLYDTLKLRSLGGLGEVYAPAYVEDLDLGVRGWQLGWPTVLAAQARTVHAHRSTTSRYFTEAELERVLEVNYLRFLARTVRDAALFEELWSRAIERLNRQAALQHHEPSLAALRQAWKAFRWIEPPLAGTFADEWVFAAGSGDVAVFPGRAERHSQTIVVASCYSPFPLSHGGAVRIYNLMRRGASEFSQILVCFVDQLHTPPPELLDICVEIVQVKRLGSHVHDDTGRPDVVEDFDRPAFRAALRLTISKWAAGVVQLEFTQMGLYAADCAPARTVLVEHDITLDLYSQLFREHEDWEFERQLERWERFEPTVWRQVDVVVTMSAKDAMSVKGARRVLTLGNGVDLQRFTPGADKPENNRILFVGSFAHLPNLLALDFFVREIWPHLADLPLTLHVIAGANHEQHFLRFRDQVSFRLDVPGMELEGFVSDVRPAYRRASAVIAPLLASAGTNIKISEAMAMGKAIVSTPGGINGLDELTPGRELLVEHEPAAFAAALRRVLGDADLRRELERRARAAAERHYDWDSIAIRQRQLYGELLGSTSRR